MTSIQQTESQEIVYEVTGGLMTAGTCILTLRRLVDGQRMYAKGKGIEEALSAAPVTREELVKEGGLAAESWKFIREAA